MSIQRSPDIDRIISRLKARHETELKGIVTPAEVRRLCCLIRELLNGWEINEDEREVLLRYAELQRCFTVAEANRIASIHGRVKFKRARLEKEAKDGGSGK
jgi:hypothetical protein